MNVDQLMKEAIKRNPDKLTQLLHDGFWVAVKFKVDNAQDEEQAFDIIAQAVGDSPVLSQYLFTGYNPLLESQFKENDQGSEGDTTQ